MIGKVMTGKSFRGCLGYCLEDKALKEGQQTVIKNRAEVLYYHQCFGDKKELTEQFNDVRQLNRKLSKPVLHITLSFAPGEKVEKATLLDMIKECALAMGFGKGQYIAVSHCDTDHQHLHLVANRIGFDGRTVSDSNSYKKIADYCRKMEKEYNLKQVLNPRKYLPPEQRLLPRSDSRKEALKKDIRTCLSTAKSYSDFEARLKALGYRVEKGRGIAFTDSKGVRTKGSEVGFSLSVIERKIAGLTQGTAPRFIQKQEPERALIPDRRQPDLLLKKAEKAAKESLHLLLRPEIQSEPIPIELQKQKKKRRSQHL